jgi:predicted dinucleotide-binding enzyme
MEIGIIGSGNIGKTLAKQLVLPGHKVCICNSRGPQSLKEISRETGAIAVGIEEAVHEKDIVVIAIPEGSVLKLNRSVFSQRNSKTIFIDTGNYYPHVRDVEIPEIEKGMAESEWVSRQLEVPVIKAFNNITVGSLDTRGLSRENKNRICLPVAGDDSEDKQVIMGLIHSLGFDSIDAGSLTNSWRQQPGTPAYCTDLDVANLKAALAKAEYSKMAQYRLNALSDVERAIEKNGSLAAAAANAGRA